MKKTIELPPTGVLIYQALCGLAALAAFVVRYGHTYYLANFLTLTIGIGAVAAVLRIGPILYLGVLGFSILIEGMRSNGIEAGGRGPSDILLSLAVLAYMAGHYRLQCLTHSILPVDQRRRSPDDARKSERPARSGRLVTTNEVGTLVLTLPIWALAAQFLWIWLGREWDMPDIPGDLGRLLLALWHVALSTLLAATVFAHWRRRQYDELAATMLLQDILWRETRGEQRRINRFYVHGAMRGEEDAEERRQRKDKK